MRYPCASPWNSAYISGTGEVTTCQYGQFGSLGNIRNQSLEAIWNGPRARRLRQALGRGQFIQGSCGEACRIVLWDRLYGQGEGRPPIPWGLGRLEDEAPESPRLPSLVGLALDGRCNLRCSHCCNGSEPPPGLGGEDLERLWPALAQAEMIRFTGGEFSINPAAFALLDRIGAQDCQPLVFLNTNGQVPVSSYSRHVEGLIRFHLKFSMEGVGPDFARVRRGGDWGRFDASVREARDLAQRRREEGRDWRVLLNYCVMRSNFSRIPEALAYAAELDIPIILNVISGIDHLDENLFVFGHLLPGEGEREALARGAAEVLARYPGYSYAAEAAIHVRYILDALEQPKLPLSRWAVDRIHRLLGRSNGGRLLNLLFKYRWDPRALRVALRRAASRRVRRAAEALRRQLPGLPGCSPTRGGSWPDRT